MRPILAAVVVAVILGGLQLYMQSRPQAATATSYQPAKATGQFDIQVTLTFDAAPDPFAFDADNAVSLLLRLHGQDVLRRTDEVPAGSPLRIRNVNGVIAGPNEFFLEAIPRDTGQAVSQAIRIQIFRDDVQIGDQTFWSRAELGSHIVATIIVDTPNERTGESHAHEGDQS